MNHAETENRFHCSVGIAVLLAGTLLSCTSHATNFTWDGQISSSWGGSRNVGSVFVPKINTNWEPDGYSSLLLPTSSDHVIFGEYSSYNRTVNLGGNRSVRSLEFKSAQDFTLSNGTLSLASGDVTSTSTYTQTLDADITLQNGGTWNVSWAPVIVNGQINSNYSLRKTGVGPLYFTNNDNQLHTTFIKEGSFKIQDGGSLTNRNGYIGETAGTLAAAYVTGANSSWTNTESIHVGWSGRGTLEIIHGGTISISKTVELSPVPMQRWVLSKSNSQPASLRSLGPIQHGIAQGT